ncbi:hypothetical protein [Azoarcus sp. DN11]|uniref:hypothetical protein n=1 Tax=Azoarcus sp. DN11 TaxID=356837 RepID=UPI000FE1C114|nr:hypothetical protein [Azoarcus sp. DN11]
MAACIPGRREGESRYYCRPVPDRSRQSALIENRPARLLVVDDDPVTSARLDVCEGYEVLAATNGEGMWREIFKQRYVFAVSKSF